METIHVIIKQEGQYDDYCEIPLKAFTDLKKAKKFVDEYDKKMEKRKKIACKRDKEIQKEINKLRCEDDKKIDELWDEYESIQDFILYEGVKIKTIELIK